VRADQQFIDRADTSEAAEIYERRTELASRLRQEPIVPTRVAVLLRSPAEEDRLAALALIIVHRETPHDLLRPILEAVNPEQPFLVRYYAAQALAAASTADLAVVSTSVAQVALAERDPLVRVTLLPTITRLRSADRIGVIAQYVRESEETVKRASYVAAKAADFAADLRTALKEQGDDESVRAIDALEADLQSKSR